MFKYIKIICLILLNLFSINFSFGNVNVDNVLTDKIISKLNYWYLKSEYYITNNQYDLAIENLNNIIKYDKNIFSEQSYLTLIYLNYCIGEYKTALKLLDICLIKENYKYFDYLYYMYGLVYIKISENKKLFLKDILFPQDNIHDNYKLYKKIFKYFQIVIRDYPDSIYYIDSVYQMSLIKKNMQLYEYNIIQFLYLQGNYISVINRVFYMMEYYSYNNIMRLSLILMSDAYYKLGCLEEFNIIRYIIKYNQYSWLFFSKK